MSKHIALPGGLVTSTEERVALAVKKRLRENDILITGLRFHDHQFGDVEIDLLILFPDAGCAVVEVKGGHISFAHGKWWQTGADGVREINPAYQGLKGIHSLKRFIERQPSWSRGKLRGDWFLAFPDTALAPNEDLGPEGRRESIIAAGEEDETVFRCHDILSRPGGTPLPASGWAEQVAELVQGLRNSPSSIEQRVAQRLKHSEQLTTEQTKILDLLRHTPRMEISGGAGSGKTWLAMEQAQRWAEQGLAVAFLTYTRGVSEMVRAAMHDLPQSQQPAFIGTFHYLGYHWGVTPTPEQENDSTYWTVGAPHLFATRARELSLDQKFDAIVVDEAQDFAQSWWDVVWAAAKDQNSVKLAIFRDESQDVFEDRDAHPEITLARFPLDDNLRNARQVVNTFAPLTDNTCTVRGGEGFPTRIIFAEPDAVIEAADDAVSFLVDESGWLPEQVALITTRSRHPVQVERQAKGKEDYWQGLWDTDDIFYSTVNGFKGLERPAIVIAVNGFHSYANPRHVMYTAISRASDLAIIVGTKTELTEVLGERHLRRLIRRQDA